MEKKLAGAAVFFYHLLMGQAQNNMIKMMEESNNRLLKKRILSVGLARRRLQNAKVKKIGALAYKSPGSVWWRDVFLAGTLSEAEFKESFRVSKDTFTIICNKLKPVLRAKSNSLNTHWRRKEVLTVTKKVAIGLYYLGSGSEYRVVGNQFGVHKSTVCKVVYEVVMAITKVLTPNYISFPNEAEAIENASLFQQKSRIPNIIGAIDSSHIPITPPKDGYRDYINKKGWPSLVLQGVVGPTYKFLDISVKQPGRSHDMAAFLSSQIYKSIEEIMPQSSIILNDKEMPYVIVGDPAYPLLPWMLKGFSGGNLTPEEDNFNTHLNSATGTVQNAFGRLKARWRCLLKRLDIHHSFAPYIIAACCTLHNMVETLNDNFCINWMQAVEKAELIFEQPKKSKNCFKETYAGYSLRVFLSEYLQKNIPPTSLIKDIKISFNTGFG